MKEKLEKEYSNYFMKEIEKKYTGKNPIKRLISYIRFRKFISKIRNWSPSIGVLWFFADFIKIAERVYFFNNKKDEEIYSSSNYMYGENGFIITAARERLKISCKLYSDNQKVIIEVRHLNGSGLTTEHKFIDGKWPDDNDTYDEVLIDNVIGIINRHIIKLVEYCWYNRGCYDYGITKLEKRNKRSNKTK